MRRRNRYRNIILVLVVAVAAMPVYAGGQQEDAEEGPVTLELWTYYTSEWPTGEGFFAAIDDFNASQDEIEIDIQSIPFEQFNDQVVVAASGNQLPDLIQMDSVDHASFVDQGIFSDLSDEIDDFIDLDDIYEGPLSSAEVEDGLYGIPITSNALALIYNQDMLEEVGYDSPPETWDELMEYSVNISEHFGSGVYGFSVPAPQNEVGTFQFMPFLWGAGADHTDLTHPGAEQALQLYAELVETDGMSPEVFNWDQADTYGQFETQRAAMYIDGPWRLGDLNEIEEFEWGIAPIPTPEADQEPVTVLGGENLAIVDTEDDRIRNAALEFISFLYQDDILHEFNETAGMVPPRRSVTEASDFYTQDPAMSVFAEIMPSARARGPAKNWPERSEIIQNMIQAAGTGQVSPENAAEDAASNMEPLLD